MGTYEVRLESVVSVWLVLGNLLVQFWIIRRLHRSWFKGVYLICIWLENLHDTYRNGPCVRDARNRSNPKAGQPRPPVLASFFLYILHGFRACPKQESCSFWSPLSACKISGQTDVCRLNYSQYPHSAFKFWFSHVLWISFWPCSVRMDNNGAGCQFLHKKCRALFQIQNGIKCAQIRAF